MTKIQYAFSVLYIVTLQPGETMVKIYSNHIVCLNVCELISIYLGDI